ncbi:MAG: amidohydrolase family protein, partial [Pseudomonadota bacterium]
MTGNLILFDANIVTLDPFRPRGGWVFIRNGRIIGLGDGRDWEAYQGKETKIIHCRGMTVLPGFIDPHIHLISYAESFSTVDLRPKRLVRSIADIQSQLRAYARHLPPGAWIRGKGYDEFYLAEKRHPNRRDLDRAVESYPVKLTHRSGHAHVLNSLGLKRAGISVTTPDPPGGLIDRDF